MAFLGITIAAVMMVGIFVGCPNPAVNGQAAGPTDATTVATVMGKPVSATQVDKLIAQQEQQLAQFGGAFPTDQKIGMIAGLMSTGLRQTAILALAEKEGVKLDDEAILAFAKKGFEEAVEMERTRFIADKKIKENATRAEFSEAIKKEYGQSLEDIEKRQTDDITAALKDPQRRDEVLAAFAEQLYLEGLAAKNPISDADLKAQYDSLTVKRILLRDAEGKDQTELANRIIGEVKGGLKFEEAMNRYSKDMPQPNKTVSENTMTIAGSQLGEESFAPLKNMKDGEVSGAIKTPEGTVIYKLISKKNTPPDDFEKNKAKYAKDQSKAKAMAEMQKQVDAIIKGNEVKWTSPGYKAMYDLNLAMYDPQVTDKKPALEKVMTEAKAALGDPVGKRMAAMAYFGAVSALANQPGADRAALGDARAEAIAAMLESNEDVKLRLELVDLYVEQKKNDMAADALLKAATFNTDTSAAGQAIYAEVQGKFMELKEKGILTKEQETAINVEQARWRETKADNEKMAAEQKKREEEERKKAEADAKKAREEGEKAAESGKAKAGGN